MSQQTDQVRWKNLLCEIFRSDPEIDPVMADNLAEFCLRSLDRWMAERASMAENGHGAANGPDSSTLFDPYEIGAVATILEEGSDALLARLERITSAEHLLELAACQHLTVPADAVMLEDIRAAIVLSAERRIDRRVKASR